MTLLGYTAPLYDTTSGVDVLRGGFDLAKRVGGDVGYLRQIAALRALPVAGTTNGKPSWDLYLAAAQATIEVVGSKYPPEQWATVGETLRGKYNALRRDPLDQKILWVLWAKDKSFKTDHAVGWITMIP